MKTTAIVASALAAALSALATGAAHADEVGKEKCYGIAKAGQNDCQNSAGSCAATSKIDAQPDAWIYVPTGTCSKIVGGSLEPKKT